METETAAIDTRRKGRMGGLDTLRGLALIAMASYHFTWNLEYFGYLEPGTATTGLWKLYARAIASSFLFLAGFSLFLAHGKAINWPSFGKRFAMVAGSALLITIATYVAFRIASSFRNPAQHSRCKPCRAVVPAGTPLVTLLSRLLPLRCRNTSSRIFQQQMAGMGRFLHHAAALERLCAAPAVARALSCRTCGFAIRHTAQLAGPFSQPKLPRNLIATAGRHSLAFYLIHQPALIGLVYAVSLVAPPPPGDGGALQIEL